MKWKWRNDRRSERNLRNCVKKPEKNPGLQRGLNPWLAITEAMPYPLSYEATDVGSRSIVGSYVPVKEIWPAPNVSGFIAQLVEHRTGNHEVRGSNPIEVLDFFSGFFTQLHKLRSLRRSLLHFHFISAVPIWFISYIINTHFFHGNIWTHNWPAPNVSGFIAQLVEHRTGIGRSRVQTPLKSWFFFFSRFFTQWHKLRSLRRSFLHFHCISAVHIWFIPYIIYTNTTVTDINTDS